MTMDAKTVGQRIKAAREKKNLTQDELAALVNISTTHMSVIERGVKIPRLDTFVAIQDEKVRVLKVIHALIDE